MQLPLVDREDEVLLKVRAWKPHGKGSQYFKVRIGVLTYYLHRVIAGAGPGQIVDHINGDPMDCRRSNLRVCNSSQSNANRRARKDSRAPFKGITLTPSGRWQAQIMKDKKFYNLGLFGDAEGAARAYDKAAVDLHGEFARTNGFVTYERNIPAGSSPRAYSPSEHP